MRKTIFLDIDGTLIQHNGDLQRQLQVPATLLPGVREKLTEWLRKDYMIILTTGRKESCREETEDQMRALGIYYDQLVMGLPRGERVVINDFKETLEDAESKVYSAGLMGEEWTAQRTASAINVFRNEGLQDIQDI